MERKIITLLKSMMYLVDKPVEYGGFIDINTNTCSGLIIGTKTEVDFKFKLEEGREESNRGHRVFHSHPKTSLPGPSGTDVLLTAVLANTTYVITKEGIYELIPEIRMDIRQVFLLDNELLYDLDEYYTEDLYYEETAKLLRIKVKLHRV